VFSDPVVLVKLVNVDIVRGMHGSLVSGAKRKGRKEGRKEAVSEYQ
jgi:hypothetical protein